MAGRPTVLLAGGGTGGHLYPALAIAEELKKITPDIRLVFAGTKKKIEARVVPQKGYEFAAIWISGFHRRLTLENVMFPLKVGVSIIQSFFLIKKIAPLAVIGTGGYVCGPVLFVASKLGIPTIVHESNSYPGVTTRLLAKSMTAVFITFEATRQWLDRSAKVDVVGTPTRDEIDGVTKKTGCRQYDLSPDKKTLFAFGGSLGARSINALMPSVIAWAVEQDVQVIWQTGNEAIQISEKLRHHRNVRIMRYVDAIEYAYAAADVVLCRGGATTLAEITRIGKPAVIVPYPHAAANHQELNARTMVEEGAALMIHDDRLQEEGIRVIKSLLTDDARRSMMSEQCRSLGKPDAGKIIAAKIMSVMHA